MRALPPRESQIQAAVMDHWRKLGMPDSFVAAVPNAGALGQPGLTRGVADLIVLSPLLGQLTGFLELKRSVTSPVSKAQREFHELCERLGVPRAIAIGRDEPIDILVSWGAVRGSRHI